MTRLGVLVNPASGRGLGAKAGPVVIATLRSSGYEVVDLTAPDALSARTRAAAFLLEGGADALIAVGGDGVVNLAVNAVLTHAPAVPIGLVAAGTGNDTARMLELPLRDHAAATTHLIAALGREPRVIDVGVITPGLAAQAEGSATRRYFVTIASVGVDAAVVARTGRLRWPKGPARYVLGLLIELVHFRGFDTTISVDGVDVAGAGTIAAVANSSSFGGGMHIAPQASWTDGLFHVITAPTVARRTLLQVFPRVYKGTHVEHPVVTVTTGREVVLDSSGRPGRKAPAPLAHADGEPVGPVPLTLRVQPGALRVLA